MSCDDIDRCLAGGMPLPLQAKDHVRSCNRCQELVGMLNMSVAADPPSPATIRQITEGLVAELRPVRPTAPARYFLGGFVGVFACIVALGVYRLGAFAMAVMTPLQIIVILGVLAISAGLVADSLVQQMVPGSRHRVSPAPLLVGITIALTMAIAMLFQFQRDQHFWGGAWACIQAGIPIGFLAAVPVSLMLRRGAILSPTITGTAAGLFAGLVGMSVLEIHCPKLDAWHILVAHLGVAILCGMAGLVIGRIADERPTAFADARR